jgi:hypothetical protein
MVELALKELGRIIERLDVSLDSGRSAETEADIDNAYRLIAVAEAELPRDGDR